MALGNNKGFGTNIELMIIVAVIAIIAAIAIPHLVKANITSDIIAACQFLTAQLDKTETDTKAETAVLEQDEGTEQPEPVKTIYSPSLKKVDDKIEMTFVTVKEAAKPDQKIGLSAGYRSLILKDRVEIVSAVSFFLRYIIFPLGFIYCLAGIANLLGEFAGEKKNLVTFVFFGILFGMVGLIAGLFLMGVFNRDKAVISNAGLQKSEATFSTTFTPEGDLQKAEGFAVLEKNGILVWFHYDEEGNLTGEKLAQGNEEEIHKVCAALNAVIPDTEVKRVLTTNDTNSTNYSEEKSGGGDITTENTEDTEGSEGREEEKKKEVRKD